MKMTIQDIEQAIENIKTAITMVIDGEMSDLAYETDLWNDGIHHFMDSDIPFDLSFDEMMISSMSEKKYNKLEAEMIEWLGKCLGIAYKALKKEKKALKKAVEPMKIVEPPKAKTLCLRFVKAGHITVEAPRDWDKMDEREKGMWANVHLESVDTEELFDSLRDDEDAMCEAIENVENGYTADIPYTNLWVAYRGEDR